MEGKIKIGPAGNNKSTSMMDWDEGSHNGIITQIFLSHGTKGIMSIQFQFMLDNKIFLSDLHGTNTGSMFDVITLDYPNEYITGISGTQYHTNPEIKSLQFTTNIEEYGPFGDPNHYYTKFGFKLGKFRQFGGVYGSFDLSGIQQIGIYLQPTFVRPKTDMNSDTSIGEETTSKIALV